MNRLRILTVLAVLVSLWGSIRTGYARTGIQLYIPFDGTVSTAIGTGAGVPVVTGPAPVFAPGLRGQALLAGGRNSASITIPPLRGTPLVDVRQGTICFWVQTVGWDASEGTPMTFVRFLNSGKIYLYSKDTLAFVYNQPDYPGRNFLYRAALPLRRGQWFHVAITWLDEIVNIYVNGQIALRDSMRDLFKIAGHDDGISFYSGDSEHQVMLDEFYLLDYPLSDTQLAAIAQGAGNLGPADVSPEAPARVFTAYYPSSEIARVRVDLRGGPYEGQARSALFDAAVDGGPPSALGQNPDSFDREHLSNGYHTLPHEMPAGNVQIRAMVQDAGGNTIATVPAPPFERRVYPWMTVPPDVGVSDEVFAPFTPLVVDKNANSVSCWGRTYSLRDSGWPAQISSRDADLLAAPVALAGSLGGRAIQWTTAQPMSFTKTTPGAVEFTSQLTGGPAGAPPQLTLNITGRMEFDGMIKYTVALAPTGNRVQLDSLQLEVPMVDAHALLYHVVRDAPLFTNESAYVPGGNGVVWRSSTVPSHGVLGSFVPYFWLGDYDRGLCWMADSDKGWSVPDDADCADFSRDNGTLTARVHFITTPLNLTEAHQYVFALMAGPPRPEPAGWRMGRIPRNPPAWRIGKNEGDMTGFTSFSAGSYSVSPQLELYAYGEPADMDGFRKWAATYPPTHDGMKAGIEVSPCDIIFDPLAKMNNYFQLEWRPGIASPVRNNSMAYLVDKLMADGLTDGMYADHTWPVPSVNTALGPGFRRADGKVQAGYRLFDQRDFFKRLAYLHAKYGGKVGLVVHMTDAMVMPILDFWDDKHDNEWGARYAGPKGDAIDQWPLGEICARSMSRQYGMVATWHSIPLGHGDQLACLGLLHDIIVGGESIQNRTIPAKVAFGLGQPDAEFLGYWALNSQTQPNAGGDVQHGGVKASAWLRRGQHTALMTVANLTDRAWEGTLTIPLDAMSLQANAVAADGEQFNAPLPFAGGALQLSVPRHDYRFILLGPPGVFPASPMPDAQLPKPANLLTDLCDDLAGPQLNPAWKSVGAQDAEATMEMYQHRLCVSGLGFRFAAAERPCQITNGIVQVRVEKPLTAPGQSNVRTGLALIWPDGTAVYAGPDMGQAKFRFALFQGGKETTASWGGAIDTHHPGIVRQLNWVRIELTPDRVRFSSSANGTDWTAGWDIKRPVDGPTALLRLGNDPDGMNAPQVGPQSYSYFANLVVGTN